jgi:hypothetical protein
VESEIHELEDRFKATWLALDTKNKQASPGNQELSTSPDADPSGPLVHEGFKAISALSLNKYYASPQ